MIRGNEHGMIGNGSGHGHGGGTVTLTTWETLASGASTYSGTDGVQDWLYLGGSGSTVTLSSVERLAGGAGTDIVTLAGTSGNTICVSGVETLTGSANTDMVVLAAASTIVVSGVETLIGSGGADMVTIASGTVNFEIRGDSTKLTLAASNGSDTVVLNGNDGGGRGPSFANTASYNQISNFQSGTDKLVLSGSLKRQLDDNSDGAITAATAVTNSIDIGSAEVVSLSTTVSSLTDTDFAAVRSAIGSLTNSSRGADVLVLASDGTNSGAYMVRDNNGDGMVSATEIKLVAVLTGVASIFTSDLSLS